MRWSLHHHIFLKESGFNQGCINSKYSSTSCDLYPLSPFHFIGMSQEVHLVFAAWTSKYHTNCCPVKYIYPSGNKIYLISEDHTSEQKVAQKACQSLMYNRQGLILDYSFSILTEDWLCQVLGGTKLLPGFESLSFGGERQIAINHIQSPLKVINRG